MQFPNCAQRPRRSNRPSRTESPFQPIGTVRKAKLDHLQTAHPMFLPSLALALLLASNGQAADASDQGNAPVVVEEARQTDSPFLMNTGLHAKRVCEEKQDGGFQLVCLSWINGASQGNGWTKSLRPSVFPDYCPPRPDFDFVQYRKVFLDYLSAQSKGKLNDPAILLFREAMAARFPCSAGERE